MGIKEGALALADELEAFEDGDCEECSLYGQPECKGHLSCMEIMARYAARKMREAVERDGEGTTTVSAYDLLKDLDRKALAWVREMGGVEAVKASIHQGAMEHGCLLKVAEMLGTSIYDGTGNADALLDKLEKRLMPAGCEWPRFEDGEPVKLRDAIVPPEGGEPREVDCINHFKDCWYIGLAGASSERLKRGECVKRPQVLAADGEPLREGEHVYHVETGAELVVKKLPKPGEYQAVVVFALPTSPASHLTSFDPDRLTHERPDSWERIDEDAGKNPFDYCNDVGLRLDTCLNAERVKSRDIVRRARKLAERGA